jgi:cellulose synthase (UDP-forming)
MLALCVLAAAFPAPARASGGEHWSAASPESAHAAAPADPRRPLQIVALLVGAAMLGAALVSDRAADRRIRSWDGPPPDTMLYGSRIGFSRCRRALGVLAAGLIAATGVRYLAWRPSTLPGTGPFGVTLFGTELILFLFTLLSAALLVGPRIRSGPPGPPRGSLDVFIPVAGEDASVVEQTLEAALAIRYPHRTYLLNDGRKAGKANWRDAERLAARFGVPCFTREGGGAGKAGNLNHALARTDGEFVAVIDADHRAHPDFAHEVLGYFADERVAFVCTPQQFEGDAPDHLNNRELHFYRAMQPAKDGANSAFSCGNASTYRRAALAAIGGVSEWNIVEDLHTSYELHANGWRSVFHPRALTVGTAPQTASALAKQRLTWATDSLRILFFDNPLRKRGLSPRQRLHYLQTTGWYLVGGAQIVFVVGPLLHLLLGQTVIGASMRAYLAHSVPYFAAMAAYLVAYGGARGGLRSAQATLFLAPLFLLAAARAATGIRFCSGVTEKPGHLSRFSRLTAVPTLAAAVSALAIALALRPSDVYADVSAMWAGWIAFTLAGFVTAVDERLVVRVALRGAARAAVLLLLALVLFTPHAGQRPLLPLWAVLLATANALAAVAWLRLRELRGAAAHGAGAPIAVQPLPMPLPAPPRLSAPAVPQPAWDRAPA